MFRSVVDTHLGCFAIEGDENGVVIAQNPKKGEYVVNGSEVRLVFAVKAGEIGSDTEISVTDTLNQPTVSVVQNSVPVIKRKTGKVVS